MPAHATLNPAEYMCKWTPRLPPWLDRSSGDAGGGGGDSGKCQVGKLDRECHKERSGN